MANEGTNGANPRRLYNNLVICDAIGLTPKAIIDCGNRAGVTSETVKKIMNGTENVGLRTLINVMEACGATYEQVFDPRFYNASNSPKETAVPENDLCSN